MSGVCVAAVLAWDGGHLRRERPALVGPSMPHTPHRLRVRCFPRRERLLRKDGGEKEERREEGERKRERSRCGAGRRGAGWGAWWPGHLVSIRHVGPRCC